MSLSKITTSAFLAASISPLFAHAQESVEPRTKDLPQSEPLEMVVPPADPIESKRVETTDELFSVLHSDNKKTPLSFDVGIARNEVEIRDPANEKLCLGKPARMSFTDAVGVPNPDFRSNDRCEGGVIDLIANSSTHVVPLDASEDSAPYLVTFDGKMLSVSIDASGVETVKHKSFKEPDEVFRRFSLDVATGVRLGERYQLFGVSSQLDCVLPIAELKDTVKLCADARLGLTIIDADLNNSYSQLQSVPDEDSIRGIEAEALGQIGLHYNDGDWLGDVNLAAGMYADYFKDRKFVYANPDGTPIDFEASSAYGPTLMGELRFGHQIVSHLHCAASAKPGVKFGNEKIPEKTPGLAGFIELGLSCGFDANL